MGPLEILRVIFGFILVLFIPGFALTWALFPHRGDLTDIERLAYTFVLSILSVMLGVLFMDVKLGLEVTTVNIILVIAVIVLASVFGYIIQAILIERGTLQNIFRKIAAIKSNPRVQALTGKIGTRKTGDQEKKDI
jgi:uncharacterized membrane protein